MKSRRPMNAALEMVELTPEALSLIRQGTPQPQIEKAAPPPVIHETKRPKPEPMPNAGLAFLSFRLPPEIAQALLTASLDRKLKRLRPWTQQEIAAEAISTWLRKQGYLD